MYPWGWGGGQGAGTSASACAHTCGAGADLAVHQRYCQRKTDIRAFALNAASHALLSSLRAWPDGACAVQRMQVHGDGTGASASAVHFDASAMGAEALAWIVDASALEERLQTAVSFAPEITLLSAPEPAALTVICEGRTSASRLAAGLLTTKPHTTKPPLPPWCIPSCPTRLPPASGCRAARYAHCCRATTVNRLMQPAGTLWPWCGLYSMNMPSNFWPLTRCSFAPRYSWRVATRMGTMRLGSHRAAWPLYLAQANRWVGGGLEGVANQAHGAWALAGDAAHALHPLAGQGLNLGLGDAAELASVLAGKEYFRSYGDMRLLRRYERARKGDAAALRVATDGLQRLFALDDARARSLRNWGMRGFEALSPAKSAVMRRAMGLV